MSFGCSIGDVIKILELANKVRQRFVDAPCQYQDLASEVRNLAIIVDDVKIFLPQRQLSNDRHSHLVGLLAACLSLLLELNRKLQMYSEIGHNPRKDESVLTQLRTAWKRLKWDPEDVEEYRQRISTNVVLLNTFYSQLNSQTSYEIKETVGRIRSYQVNSEHQARRQAILDWMSPIDYGAQNSDIFGRRAEGTGQWFLTSKPFQEWFAQPNQTMLCPGIPGAGKTILTSMVIDDLRTTFPQSDEVGIAYVYGDFRRHRTPVELLSSLLKQFLQGQNIVPEEFYKLYKAHHSKQTKASLEELSSHFKFILTFYKRSFILVDALDECCAQDPSCRSLFTELFHVQRQTQVNIFATSRFIPESAELFNSAGSKYLCFEIRANGDDVRKYLQVHMQQLPLCVTRNAELQKEIVAVIVQCIQGMFILAKLHLDALKGKRSPKAVRSALSSLRERSQLVDHDVTKVLNITYDEAMKRIESQGGGQSLGKETLFWIVLALRPLRPFELQSALAIEPGEVRFDTENISELEDIVAACAGLITIDRKSDTVRLVHYTTQEYFERSWSKWFPDAQARIANSCITCLSFRGYETGPPCLNEPYQRNYAAAIWNYAAKNWGHHARFGSTEVDDDVILAFLESRERVVICTHAALDEQVPRYKAGPTALHLAAIFGLDRIANLLLHKGHPPDVKADSIIGPSPLWHAAAGGHNAIVLRLLEEPVNVNCLDHARRSPLFMAAAMNRVSVVTSLLAHSDVDVNIRLKESGETTLLHTINHGLSSAAKHLIAHDRTNVNLDDVKGKTPLLRAVERGDEEIVQLLLAHPRIDANVRDYITGATALSAAVSLGDKSIYKLLLSNYKVDPSPILSQAVASNDKKLFRFIVGTENFDVNSTVHREQTPLHCVAIRGREEFAALLLSHPHIDVNSRTKDKDKQTPLHCATFHDRKKIVELLSEHGEIDINAKTTNQETALLLAAGYGRCDIARLLLENDKIDVRSPDHRGSIPLHYAAENGHLNIVELLLARADTDPNAVNRHGLTPLHCAAQNGKEYVVSALLDTKRGTDINIRDLNGETALFLAAENGHESTVRMLLEREDLDVNAESNWSNRTPLQAAAAKGYESTMRLLASGHRVKETSGP